MSNPDVYSVGWICAISTEYIAAQEFLDEEHDLPEQVAAHDNNNYTLGKIGNHNVVIAVLPGGEYGTATAASVARDMLHSFPNIRIGLLVGIGGGAPSKEHDVRLGDIVVGASGVFQYDFGKIIQDEDFKPTRVLDQAPMILRTASDRLFKSDIVHGSSCGDSCSQSASALVVRPERDEYDDDPAIHYGIIASGNQLMKHALIRDKLSADRDVLCFEMEAAGLMNHFPCLVIRGICDYSDSHKSKEWQGHAALLASAYAKDILKLIPASKLEAEKKVSEVISDVLNTISAIDTKLDNMQSRMENEDDIRILNWLTPVDYSLQHSDYTNKRFQETGQWFLDSTQFQMWMETGKETLFCPGIPGAGKTIITSIVINELFKRFKDDVKIGIAYVYCDFRRQSEQSVENLMANILKQLARAQQSMPSEVRSLYQQFFDANTSTNLFITSRIIPEIVKRFETSPSLEIRAIDQDVKTYLAGQMERLPSFVLTNPDLQDQITATITKLVKGMFLLAPLHIDTLAGEPTVGNLKLALQSLPSGIEETYNQAMRRIENQGRGNRELAKDILAWLVHAKRVFSTIELQHAVTIKPGDLELNQDFIPTPEMIASICAGLVTIDSQSKVVRLVHQTTQEYFDQMGKGWFVDAEAQIATSCVTYLSFKEFESGMSQTQEIFDERLRKYPFYDYAAHNWGHHAREAHVLRPEFIDFVQRTANLEASSQVLMANEDLSQDYIRDTPKFMTSLHLAAYFGIQMIVEFLLKEVKDAHLRDSDGFTPLFYAVMNGHQTIASMLLEAPDREDDNFRQALRREAGCRTALRRVGIEGYAAVVQLFTKVGLGIGSHLSPDEDESVRKYICVMTSQDNQNLQRMLLDAYPKMNWDSELDLENRRKVLCRAAFEGHTDIVRLLLDKGVDLEWNPYLIPLNMAAINGGATVVKLLLDKGANINITCDSELVPSNNTPLHWAACVGNYRVVELLLAEGAVVDARSHGHRPIFRPFGEGKREWVGAGAYIRETSGLTPLHLATNSQHPSSCKETARLLLHNKADPNARSSHGFTPLQYAVSGAYTDEKMVKMLLDSGADVNAKDNQGIPIIYLAIMNKNISSTTIQLLLAKGADTDCGDAVGTTLLSLASIHNNESIAKLLIDEGVNVNTKNRDGRTALHHASAFGNVKTMRRLLDKGADIHGRDDFNGTALLWAAANPKNTASIVNKAVVSLLLDHGAETNSKYAREHSPLAAAALTGCEASCNLLLTKDVEVNSQDELGRTPLMKAAFRGHVGIVKSLLKSNEIDINLRDNDDTTALWLASYRGHRDVTKLLLATKGIEVNSKTLSGVSALSVAADEGHEEIFDILLTTEGIEVNSKNTDGQTPLWHAAGNGYEIIVRLLLATRGIEVDSKDALGRTPLFNATRNGHKIVSQMLLATGKADSNSLDSFCVTPLSAAARLGHADVCEHLALYTGLTFKGALI
ncbi:hypothetical protein H072_6021 [Dactylellina haptotyla CBS 200.50]|uniref:protein S-acyltransferase n=1 Tax=Dactylellina haptotyla (strain CBS 200.50) TaxID=1284197 RepID=S8AB34_DACHA|nr:hypothetical protein H072_6021 [Dactylellina haptotyla CBS 200.50]